MKIGYTMAEGRGGVDLLLAGLADRLQARGLRTCGTVQINTECEGRGPCDMDVRVLPDGPVIRISQSLGTGARGCRLDPSALESAVAQVEARLAQGADVLIINKFGRHEAEGHGFRELIADALAREIPILVGVNRLNESAFQEFAAGLALRLEPDADALAGWIEGGLPQSSDAA
ncbi:DUF2478 domain-containing protein [Pelagibius sp.]|uniref:DUF2478 domain-containing protein n=1 Tax=Pelagibius sp. TaxID=1931238 RepID=UPI003B5116C0